MGSRPSLLGQKVQFRLEQLGMSRRELSRRTGLSRQTIHNIEHEGSTHLKPSTFNALDAALKWKPGTALAFAMGEGTAQDIGTRLIKEYVCQIALHLAQMTTEELELTLIMMEENQLGTHGHSTEEFTRKVADLVSKWLEEIAQIQGG